MVETLVEEASPAAALTTPPGAEQDYAPNPAIWRLADEDTTIYLFGTIHVLPPGFAWRSAEFDRIVGEVDQLVLETSDEDGTAQLEAMLPQMIEAMLSREPTSDRMAPENGKKFLKLGRMAGIDPVEFDTMPLILALMGVGLNASALDGSMSEFGVETVLTAEFAELGKPVGSIENSADVMVALLGIDEGTIIAAVEHDLAEWDGGDLDSLMLETGDADTGPVYGDADNPLAPFAMEHAWAKGIISEQAMFDDSPLGLAMSKVLLEDRNRAWAEWLDRRLDTPGTILLAVGAGHFEGEVSVLRMLEARGLEVSRIN
ncbi:TraB/GumN family protein [Parerythrobacter lacustris]|uniref:TraB/GumN family protein n=1 Tax=Parerythrobacter lacustris TaxID=2969984 RepID=A0ABT1XQJ2_9SPHN|nr:TraB/GumN family protein [Parerythrobacter lacustris]